MGCSHGNAHGAESPGQHELNEVIKSSWAKKTAAAANEGRADLEPPVIETAEQRQQREKREKQEQKEQQKQAQKLVKDFVTDMVRGKKFEVVLKSGQSKTCACSLSRALDTLKIKVGGEERRIALVQVRELHAGAEVSHVDTPLDELCATLVLASDEAITFRFPDTEERDTFVMCLLMFIQRQQQDTEEPQTDP